MLVHEFVLVNISRCDYEMGDMTLTYMTGQQFALMETSYVIIRFLQQYSQIESTGTGDPWTEKLTLTCSVGQGTWVSLEV